MSRNLYRIETAGVTSVRTGTLTNGTVSFFGNIDGTIATGVSLADFDEMGIGVGERYTASAEIAWDATGSDVLLRAETFTENDIFIRLTDGFVIPSPTGFILQSLKLVRQPDEFKVLLEARVSAGTGTVQIRRGMVQKGWGQTSFTLPIRGDRGFRLIDAAEQVQWSEVEPIVRNESPFSGRVQTSHATWHRWVATASWPNMLSSSFVDPRVIEASLMELRGGKSFDFLDPSREDSSTGFVGQGTVKGALQTGASLIVDGLPPDVDLAGVGDFISVAFGSKWQLFRLTKAARSSATGEVTVSFLPDLRGPPADNAAVRFSQALVTMELPERPGFTTQQVLRRGLSSIGSASFVEKF